MTPFADITTALLNAEYWLDYLAIMLFFAGWGVYSRSVDNYKSQARPSLLTVVHRLRVRWLIEMQMRMLRMPDVMALNIVTGNYTFFASTSILIIAGAFTLLIGKQWEVFISELAFVDINSFRLTPLKLLTLILIFVYSFFKFTWSIRQVGYCAVLLGGVPNRYQLESEQPPSHAEIQLAKQHAEAIAPSFTLAGNNFNYGLRAYYFGLALLPWIFGPLWLIASSTAVMFILWRREFHSKTLQLLLRAERELAASDNAITTEQTRESTALVQPHCHHTTDN